MTLSQGQKYAEWWSEFLAPHVEVLITAGSIRRERAQVNDVDIVCVPKMTTRRVEAGDLFKTSSEVSINCAYEAVMAIAEQKQFTWKGRSATTPPPAPNCKYMWLVTPKCELDLWFASAETLATRLLCRTGSTEHNIWIVARAERRDLRWKPYEGLVSDRGNGNLIRTNSEAELYGKLDMDYVAPVNREREYLLKRYGE